MILEQEKRRNVKKQIFTEYVRICFFAKKDHAQDTVHGQKGDLLAIDPLQIFHPASHIL